MRKQLITLTLLASLLTITQLAFALEVPSYSAPATDLAGLLSSGQLSDLNERLTSYRDQTGNEIAILIIQSLEGEALEDYAHKVFNTWGVGKANTDKGALFLMALDDKKTRIEVGYGLEADLTDSEAGRIVRRDSPMGDSFRSQDWAGGINAVVDGMISGIGGEYKPAPTSKKKSKDIGFAIIPLFILIGIISAIGRMARFGGRRGGGWGPFIGGMGAGGAGWSGGSSGGGGGGFSFGGGSSGGGGASGGW